MDAKSKKARGRTRSLADNEIPDSKSFRQFACTYNVSRHIALYEKTKDGLLVWKIYQEYRKFGLPVPEFVLKKFDKFAKGLSKASGPKKVAEVLQMVTKRGGPSGSTKTKKSENTRDILEAVRAALFPRMENEKELKRITKQSAYEAIGRKHKISADRVKQLWLAFQRDVKSDEKDGTNNLLQKSWSNSSAKK